MSKKTKLSAGRVDAPPTGQEFAAMRAHGVRVYEDDAGGVYLEPVGTGYVVAGLEGTADGMALTDARLWGDWWPEDDAIYPCSVVEDCELVAELVPDDEWRTYPERMGVAARLYVLGAEDGS